MKQVHLQVTDAVAEIRLRRSEKRNALSRQMIEEILDVQAEIRGLRTPGVLLTADGPSFCAGHDFAEMAGASIEELRNLFPRWGEMMLGFQSLGAAVVAAVNGPAIGAGCQLALAADLVIAGSSATFQTPGGKGSWFCTTPMLEVVRNLPTKRALEMLLIGEPVDAATAAAWG